MYWLTNSLKRKGLLAKGNKHLRLWILILTPLLLLWNPNITGASSIDPFVKDYLLEERTKFTDAFRFYNSDAITRFTVEVSAYDAQNEEPIEGAIFIRPLADTLNVPTDSSVNVRYEIDIPPATPPGTYFNIIYVQSDESPKDVDTNVAINYGFGMIAAFHIVRPGSEVKSAFIQDTVASMSILDRGLPLIRPVKLAYRYENPSNFVFVPDAEVRVFNQRTEERIIREKLNPASEKTYPGEYFETTVELDLWSVDTIMDGMKIVSRTYSQYGEAYHEQVLLIPGYRSEITWGAVISIGILLVTLMALRKFRASRMASSSETVNKTPTANKPS